VPQQFLHHLNVLAVGFQQSREDVPVNSLDDLRPRRCRTNAPLQDDIGTVRLLPLFPSASKDPVLRLVVRRSPSPGREFLEEFGMITIWVIRSSPMQSISPFSGNVRLGTLREEIDGCEERFREKALGELLWPRL